MLVKRPPCHRERPGRPPRPNTRKRKGARLVHHVEGPGARHSVSRAPSPSLTNEGISHFNRMAPRMYSRPSEAAGPGWFREMRGGRDATNAGAWLRHDSPPAALQRDPRSAVPAYISERCWDNGGPGEEPRPRSVWGRRAACYFYGGDRGRRRVPASVPGPGRITRRKWSAKLFWDIQPDGRLPKSGLGQLRCVSGDGTFVPE